MTDPPPSGPPRPARPDRRRDSPSRIGRAARRRCSTGEPTRASTSAGGEVEDFSADRRARHRRARRRGAGGARSPPTSICRLGARRARRVLEALAPAHPGRLRELPQAHSCAQAAVDADRAAIRVVEELLPGPRRRAGLPSPTARSRASSRSGRRCIGALETPGPRGGSTSPASRSTRRQHEAVLHEPGDGDGDAVVSEVLRTGYLWKGRSLRPAMVKVKG